MMWMCYRRSIPLLEGCLPCFQFLVIMSKANIDIHVEVFV